MKHLNKLVILVSIILTSCSFFGKSNVEQPKYQIIEKDSDFEVRNYSAYITANVTVDINEDYEEARNKAFKKLASYIFGANTNNNKISMTAPVIVKSDSEGTNIKMTAPVIMESSEKKMVMSFMMPSKYQLNELPTPKNQEITFKKVPQKMMATVRYSGINSKSKEDEQAIKLSKWLSEKGYRILSLPVYAGYNPPWTIPFLRRNEVMIEVGIK